MSKKRLFVLLLLAATGTARAQVKWGVQAGMVTTNNYLSQSIIGGPSYSSGTGLTLGATLNTRLFSKIWSETGLFVSQKRYRIRSAPLPDYYSDVRFRLHYATLNQQILVKVMGKNNLSFSTGAGFFVAALVNGRYVSDYSTIIGRTHEEGNVDIGSADADDFKRIDAGLNVLVRSQYKNIYLTMQYSPSFTNHVPGSSTSNYKEKLRSVAFTLGYEF
jgi:hypothetical protein